jgi:hypothetical protein
VGDHDDIDDPVQDQQSDQADAHNDKGSAQSPWKVPFSPEDALTAHMKRIVKTSLGVDELPWRQMSLSIETDMIHHEKRALEDPEGTSSGRRYQTV